MNFSQKALQDLVKKPSGGVAREVGIKAAEVTANMRNEAYGMQKKGQVAGIPRPKFNEIVQNQRVGGGVEIEIGIPVDQRDSRKSNRSSAFAKFLADKAAERDSTGNSWIQRGIKKTRGFRVKS